MGLIKMQMSWTIIEIKKFCASYLTGIFIAVIFSLVFLFSFMNI